MNQKPRTNCLTFGSTSMDKKKMTAWAIIPISYTLYPFIKGGNEQTYLNVLNV